jgi:UPF0755 protein
VNTGNTPPQGNGADEARPRGASAAGATTPSPSSPGTSPNTSLKPATAGTATNAGVAKPASILSSAKAKGAGPDRTDGSALRPYIAAGLPPQPAPLGAGRAAARSNPPVTGATKPTTLSSSLSASLGAAKSDPRRSNPPKAESSPTAQRTDGSAAPLIASPLVEPKRIPRSPRAALEPDHVPLPSRPPRPRPSRRARNPLVIIGNAIFTLLVLVLVAGGALVVVGKSRFEAPGPLLEDKVVNIPSRSGMMDIADLLKREGVIDEHRFIFIGGVLALNARSGLKAGEYLFPKHASVRDVVETIVEGKVVQHQLTIPEGLTSEQIVSRLLESDILSGNIKDMPREGTLLPDSYHFNRGFTRDQMIQRMHQAQDRLVREAWERRNPDLPLKSPEQLVILASIIEKETSKPEERTRVAAVFANRLKQKMKLQTDPTVIYGLVYGKGSLGHPLTKAELAQPTPYNTYIIDGLPPGPIANPGRASIEAAANPARTKELYFAADGTGGHAFADTYEQHLKNVARLRVIEHGGDPAAAAPAPDAQAASPAPSTPAPRPAATPQRSKRGASGSAKSAGAAQ